MRSLTSFGHGSQGASADLGLDVDPPRSAFAMDHTGRRHVPDACDIGEAYLRAGLGVDQQVLDIVEASADGPASPDHHVEHLLLLEQAAHRDAADQRRRGAAHIARLQAVGPGLLQINLDIDRLLLVLLLDLRHS